MTKEEYDRLPIGKRAYVDLRLKEGKSLEEIVLRTNITKVTREEYIKDLWYVNNVGSTVARK